MTEFEKVGLEIVKFMRGNYRLDEVEHKSISADDVTWAILPYVPHQYETIEK